MNPHLSDPDSQSQSYQMRWFLIVVGMTVVLILEFSTPPAFVFGYLYIAPILLASIWLNRRITGQITAIAIALTLLNLWVPNSSDVTIATTANRVVAAMALLVTGFLSDRNRSYQDAIARQQIQILAKEELMTLREDFTSTITHDLKTPLWGAIETLNAFQQERLGAISSTQHQAIATMIRSHQNSLQLLETLLDIYGNDARGLVLNLIPIDLTALVEESATALLELAANRRVHVSFRYGNSDFRQNLWVNGDPLQLQRVVTNLLSNAINHSRRGDRVKVVLESQTTHQVVKFLDTGSGIRSDEFSHLFERFYQGHSDRQAKGTGLGLYLSRQIIEAHGGTIWAENCSPSGALFAFKLPVASPHSSTHALPPRPHPAS
jgi:two-component system, NarL family, sensor kinase